jgi:hypothetical protein
MADTNDSPTPIPSIRTENFRATATAFSQLTAVVGGFSITILVLVLGSSTLGSHKTARDWTVGLLLLAAVAYITASGLLANSMNVDLFMALNEKREKQGKPRFNISSTQQGAFDSGITLFYIGNILLLVAIFIVVYQASLLVGLIASILTFFILAIFVIWNLFP